MYWASIPNASGAHQGRRLFAILDHMKTLSLSRPLVIFVIGLPGAGKSFFARQFADTFSAPIVSYDYLRYQMFPDPAFSDDEDTLIAQIAGNEFSELLKTGKSVVLDGGNNNYENRQLLGKMAHKKGYGSFVVWVQTDEKSSRLRATKRSSRRTGDALNASMTDHAFNSVKQSFMKPGKGEPFVVISGKHTYATQAKVVLRRFMTLQDPATPVENYPTASNQQRNIRHGENLQPTRRQLSL